jgi:hypothetical protein
MDEPDVSSIAGSCKNVDGGDDVECEPGAGRDDHPTMMESGIGVASDVALIDLADIAAIVVQQQSAGIYRHGIRGPEPPVERASVALKHRHHARRRVART